MTKEKKPPTSRQLAGRQRAAETAKRKTQQRKELLEMLLTASTLRDPFEAVDKVMAEYRRVFNPPVKKSRPERWANAASAAEAALSDLIDIQQEFSDWKDNLSENLQNSPVGEKLEEICNIDLETAKSSVEEASGASRAAGGGTDGVAPSRPQSQARPRRGRRRRHSAGGHRDRQRSPAGEETAVREYLLYVLLLLAGALIGALAAVWLMVSLADEIRGQRQVSYVNGELK